MDIRRASNLLDVDLVDETDRYSTLAGYILWRLGHFPQVGDVVVGGDLVFEVVSMDQRSIEKVRIRRAETVQALSPRSYAVGLAGDEGGPIYGGETRRNVVIAASSSPPPRRRRWRF
jgi:hypothetical protein